ncbi:MULTISPECIES: extracellular solute-binding protein [Aminobacter]|jgi:multiple sugar transport system substrate-binding protein|uniref:Multiple sugar transport system substrate-binding protein n=1 Tax=Aminobacter ciceronei TaxID=150723 RepID=A0ABR6C8X8_9HYPH|nr:MULTISPECIES: extracellular solute-binding protein [Aminobacter]MBA8907681.1 multiple sugar transport system substrate-binding protein [Aminobacter ciceronei]MBA9021469.1 multiple sugar transport system substrate-binding protein [Aminobacter ciceronei]MRX32467.1 extracellular solute-binding protein [Aminobacter sp. MDW-2]QNH37711.1 extracellular solute-binding protein [Aminobacter sp. MDW-2]
MTFSTLRKGGLIAAAIASLMASPAFAKVTVLGWPGGPEETALRAAADAYNAKSDTSDANKVELLFFNRDGFWDKLQADLAAGSKAFDVNLLATYSIGRYAPFMEPVELSDEAKAVYGDSVLSTMQYEGKQFGVPTDLSLHFMYYRKDLVEALLKDDAAKARFAEISEKHLGKKLEPKNPDEWTWDDYAATALYFTQAVNPDSPTRYGTVLQLKNLLFNMMVFQSLPRSYGGNWMDESGKVTVNSDAYRKGLETYKLLYDAGATPRDSLSYEFAEANAAYASGQVAAMMQWNAAASDLTSKEKSPTVAEVTETIAPPAGPEGRFTHIHGLGFGLNKNAENKDGAKAFIKWLSSKEAALIYARSSGAPALTPDVVKEVAAERPDLVKLGEFASKYGYVMNGGTSAKALSVYELQAKEFTGYWSGQQSLDDALANTEKGMTELLK